ncbi:DUF4369 domain-containing protein [Algoriphagus sp. SE2]|uniref:DUF4369 domain-containing protein n=1 Tax=Algoriphagus sp. SE2 TaxID=3141536 RepID=UPI0031CD5099
MRFILILIVLLTSSLTGFTQSGYEIFGKVSGLGDTSLLVLHFNGNEYPELDTILTQNDQFHFSGSVKAPYFIQLLRYTSEGQTKKLTEFILENSAITISGSSLDYEDIQVSGSESDLILKEYLEKDGELKSRLLSHSEEKSIVDQSPTAANRLAPRVQLLKEYVRKYSDTVVGSLLPNFCHIENELSQSDYDEIYTSLGDEAQNSYYGQLIKEKSKNQ